MAGKRKRRPMGFCDVHQVGMGAGLACCFRARTCALKDATMLNTPVFCLEGVRTRVRVLQVYDGDTVWLAFAFDRRVFRARARLANYNSPELRPGRDVPDREAEIEAAHTAKRALEELLLNPAMCAETMAVFGKNDKFGRPLVHLFVRAPGSRVFATHVNEEMVLQGAGVPFMVGPVPTLSAPPQSARARRCW
jgi:endonuclease YncB( thermonuclease family)